MKFTDIKHTLTVSAGEATQALSPVCRKVSIFATAAMTFDFLDTDEGTLTNALVTAAAVDTAEVRTVTLTETFGIGDVLRVTVDSNNVDYTVTSANLATVASELAAAINADATVAAIVTATSSAGVVTLTAEVTAFENDNHFLDKLLAEGLLIDVPPNTSVAVKALTGSGKVYITEYV